MKTPTYESLTRLHTKYGARRFGKLCQKFLAIAFKSAGYAHVVEREVQGVDVDAGGKGKKKYAIEVKTTETEYVTFAEKDAEGLRRRRSDDYLPVLAVLRLGLLSDWVFASIESLKPGRIYISLLRAYALSELEEVLGSHFDRAVEEHSDGTMRGAQEYLNGVLAQKGVEVIRE